MNSNLGKIFVAAINKKWIKGENDMVMGYVNKSLVELTEWLYVPFG